MNPILKWGGIAGMLILLIVVARGCSNNVSDVEVGEPDTGTVTSYNGVTGSAAEELRTLSGEIQSQKNDSKDQQETLEAQAKEIQELKGKLSNLTEGGGNDPSQIQELQNQIEALKGQQSTSNAILDAEFRQKVVEDVLNDLKDTTGAAVDYAKGEHKSSRNPLLGGGSNYDYEVDGESDSASDDDIVWIAPLDAPTLVEDGQIVIEQLNESIQIALNDAINTTSNGVDSAIDEVTSLPVFTIPANTTMVGAKTVGRVLGRIPSGGEVKNPYGFKLIVPGRNLIANGHELGEVSHAFMSGFAVGDLGLRCARGYINSMTFVFTDGRISQIGDSSNLDTEGNGLLGVMTDVAGTECVSGTLKTDFPEYLTTSTVLGSITAAADAAVAAQQTTITSGDTTNTSLTGSQGIAIAGGSVAGGAKTAETWVADRWKESFDVILVEIGQNVQIEIKQEIAIDYDSNRRKVRHRTQSEAIAELGEGDIVWN